VSGNRVHRCTAFDRTDRKGGLRIFRNLDVGNDIAGAANRMSAIVRADFVRTAARSFRQPAAPRRPSALN